MNKIKLLLVCCIAFAAINSNAQQLSQPQIDSLMKEAYKYYKGSTGQLVNYTKYFELIKQCAEAGNVAAMYSVGTCYVKGKGTTVDISKAIEWLTKAAEKNHLKATTTLGYIYKKGFAGTQDYEKAFAYYSKAAAAGYTPAIFSKGYLLYTGLGCTQDYYAAYPLFQQAAAKKYAHAMRFVGLCMKNGYGTEVNKDSAIYWMQMASKYGNGMSDDELASADGENADIDGRLINKVKAAQAIIKQGNPVNTYTRVYHNIAADEIEGRYEGWLLKYDWSGKHVVKADKLIIELVYENDSITGKWIENDTTILPVRALLTRKALLFNGMEYNKYDHYYRAVPEQLRFQKAGLQLIKDKDSAYLCGDLQLYSVKRQEPAKPMYVALVRTVKGKSKQTINYVNEDGSTLIIKDLNAYPNPFTNIITLDFELKANSPVQTKIFTLDGKEVYSNAVQQLQAGSYNIQIQPQHLAPGTYILHLLTGKKAATVKVIKMD